MEKQANLVTKWQTAFYKGSLNFKITRHAGLLWPKIVLDVKKKEVIFNIASYFFLLVICFLFWMLIKQ